MHVRNRIEKDDERQNNKPEKANTFVEEAKWDDEDQCVEGRLERGRGGRDCVQREGDICVRDKVSGGGLFSQG